MQTQAFKLNMHGGQHMHEHTASFDMVAEPGCIHELTTRGEDPQPIEGSVAWQTSRGQLENQGQPGQRGADLSARQAQEQEQALSVRQADQGQLEEEVLVLGMISEGDHADAWSFVGEQEHGRDKSEKLLESIQLPNFESRDAQWPEFSFDLEAELQVAGVMSWDDFAYIKNSASPLPLPTAPLARKHASILWLLLLRKCKGESRVILRKVQPGNGPEAYRLLHERFGRQGGVDVVNVYKYLPKFDFGTPATCFERLQKFDLFQQTYAQDHPLEEIPDALLAAIVRENVPEPLKSKLEMSVPLNATYAQVRAHSESYLMQHRPYSSELLGGDGAQQPLPATASSSDPVPMEIGAITQKGAKGKSKGKGTRGECLFCGQTGHYQWTCPYWQQASKLVHEVLAENPSADAEHALTKYTPAPERRMRCFRCGKPGHMAAQCQASMDALIEQEEAEEAFQMNELDEASTRYMEELRAWEESCGGLWAEGEQ